MTSRLRVRWLAIVFWVVSSPLFAAEGQPYHLVSSLAIATDLQFTNYSNPWRNKTLNVGILSENNSPYNILVGNDLYGLNADYLNYIQQVTGIQFLIAGYGSLVELSAALAKGEIDLLFGLPANALPADIHSSKPYYLSPLRILRSRQNSRQVMLNSPRARIAVGKMTAMQIHNELDRLTPTVQRFDSNLQAIYSLLNGANDYVIADESSAGFILDQLQLGQIYQVENPLNLGSLNLVFASDNAALLEVLNQAIAATPMEMLNVIQTRWSKKIPAYLDTGNAFLTPMERDWVKQHPQVHYAAIDNNYPFTWRGPDQHPHGYIIDLLDIISQNTGLNFIPVWSENPREADELVRQERALFSAIVPLSPDIKALYNSSIPLHRALWGVYVGQMINGLSSWHDLTGLRIGVIAGDLGQSIIPPSVNQIVFPNRKAMYDALANGQLDALIDNVISANFFALSRYAGAIKLAFAANNIAYPLAFGIRPDSPLLHSIIDKSLMQIPTDTMQSLRDQWVSDRSSLIDAVNDNRMQPRTTWLLVALGIMIALSLLMALRRYVLQRKEKREREQLVLARQQADTANRMKSQFLATVSHELRTPMHAILGLLELELTRSGAETKGLTVIQNSAQSLLTLLNDLQDYARIETGSLLLSPQPLLMPAWLKQLERLYKPVSMQRNVKWVIESDAALPASLLLDGERLTQVMNNLLSNAFKFTPSGSVVLRVFWQSVNATEGALSLVVEDTGCGIDEEDVEKLFQPFFRAKSAQRVSVQGTGLGLSICKDIVERMSGQLHLRSQPEVGTTVTVTLPASVANAPEIASTTQPVLSLPRLSLRTAVVDDHPTNVLLMQQQLIHLGLSPHVFEQGRALLAAHQAHPFDVLFIDYNMPRPDGVLLVKLIRRHERQNKLTPCTLVLCSADVQEFTRLSRQSLAVEYFLTKPIALSEIAQILSHHSAVADIPRHDLNAILDQMSTGKEAVKRRLIKTLAETLRQDRQRCEHASLDGDSVEIERAIHRMKGSFLLLQFHEGAALCQQVITLCQQNRLSSVAYNQLMTLTQSLLLSLDELQGDEAK